MESLLDSYRALWNNRALKGEGEGEGILREAIARELRDEFTHPRVRKTPHEKFFLAVKRIMSSTLSPVKKEALTIVHIEELEKILP